jgi:hypothetical protein
LLLSGTQALRNGAKPGAAPAAPLNMESSIPTMPDIRIRFRMTQILPVFCRTLLFCHLRPFAPNFSFCHRATTGNTMADGCLASW